MSVFGEIAKSHSWGGYSFLNELRVNGEEVDDNDDFTMDDDVAEDNTEAPEDTATDAAEEVTDDTDATQEDDADDFTLDDDGEEEIDNVEGDPDEVAANEDDTDDDDDFTLDDDGEDTAETTEDNGGEEANADTNAEGSDNNDTSQSNNTDTSANPSDMISDEDAKQSEAQIYDGLTDDEKRIRVLQLKVNYRGLYDTMMNTIEGINGIPKDGENIETLKRLIGFVTKTKNILIDYIETNFDKNPYLENYATYIKFMAIFRTVSNVLDELSKAKSK